MLLLYYQLMPAPLIRSFTVTDFYVTCDILAQSDADLLGVIKTHGYPPFWSRPNTYESLVHFILEQQVSLASAKAALEKLRQRVTTITPETILALSVQELRSCYVSRQKAGYLQNIAEAIQSDDINLSALESQTDKEIRDTLTMLKGIGNWTVDVYLIMALHRIDHFPFGDIAAINALKSLKGLPKDAPREMLADITAIWRPYRSVATMLLWHYYLSARRKKL